MKNNLYSDILKEYSFLDDFEKQNYSAGRQNINNNTNNTNTNMDNKQMINDKYLNNYKEQDEPISYENSQKSKIESAREKYAQTKLGAFATNTVDYNRVNDIEYLKENLSIKNKSDLSNVAKLESDDLDTLNESLEVVKKNEYRFYAFLNKEFNVLNKKLIRCSMVCYNNHTLFSVKDAKSCTDVCRDNINEAKNYANQLIEESSGKLLECIEKKKKFEEIQTEDRVVSFLKCYEDLIDDFGIMENKIKQEFANFI